jgi:hypothetical protein
MNDDVAEAEFSRLVAAVLMRFLAQNAVPGVSAEVSEAVGARLWAVVTEHGLPQALSEGECGVPGGLSDDACAPLVARVMGAETNALLEVAVKQLVKTCLYPEFTVCRDSYREPTKDGGCKRQELARVRARVSGTHCVDCPHWVALAPDQHADLLARAWRVGGAGAFAENRVVFLPEDFRALRRWLHARARLGT